MSIAETTLTTLLAIWWKGAIWLLLACVVATLLKLGRASAGRRRLFWAGNTGALLLIAALQVCGPRWQIAAPEFATDFAFAQYAVSDEVFEPVTAPETGGASSAALTTSRKALSLTNWLMLAWILGTIALSLRLLRSRVHLERLWRSATIADCAWNDDLKPACQKFGLNPSTVELRQSKQVSSPMVWGVRHTKILLPASSPSSSTRRLMLFHELHHVARHDPLLNLVSQSCLLIHWPNPLAWLTSKRLRVSQEQTCDDHVLTLSHRPGSAEEYADLLVQLARTPKAATTPYLEPIGALSMTSRPSTLRRRITSILDKTMKRQQPRKKEFILVLVVQSLAAAALALLAFGAPANAQEISQTEALKKRVAELENTVNQLKEDSAEAIDQAKLEKIKEENLFKARERMSEDRNEYDNDQRGEIETLYQVANKNWRTTEAKESLERLVKKYKKANRTGCAVLYLGQMSTDEAREKYLRQAVDDFSDCYYGNGCQVGGYARYLLAAYLKDTGKTDEADKVIAEIEKDYATAIGHNGKLILSYVESLK